MQQSVHGGDVYRHAVPFDFSANINPLGTPPAVLQAMQESLSQCAQYPDPHCTALIEAIATHESVEQTQVLCGNGAADLIFSMMLAVKPKRALIQAPTFAEYEQALHAVGCEVRYFETDKQQGFAITQDILAEICADLDVLFLCNPNNPTGILIDPSLLEQIAKRCRQHEVLLVVDECFQDFVAGTQSLKPLLTDNPFVVILKAFTKMYALAGIRLGYCMTDNRALLLKMKACTQPWNVSVVAQAAGVVALQQTAFVQQSKLLIQTQRQWMIGQLEKLGFVVYQGTANYLLFESDKQLFDLCLAHGVLIRDCSNYRGLCQGFYRVAIRTASENQQLIRVLLTVMQKEES